jgi:hypothetical protein
MARLKGISHIMDNLTFFLLFVAATTVSDLLYITALIVQAVRRVGMRRFVGAVANLMGAVLVAMTKLFQLKKDQKIAHTDVLDQQFDEKGYPHRYGDNYRTGEYDQGYDLYGWYDDV